MFDMDCSKARQAISSGEDGELAFEARRPLDEHLLGCDDCRRYAVQVGTLRRSFTLGAATVPVDMADRVMAKAIVFHAGTGQWVRYALGVVAASLVVLNIPLLIAWGPEADHGLRHAGAFGVALGVGLGWAALRPERAIGLVPYASALALAILIGAVVDITTGRATTAVEAVHLLELVGVGLLWLLTGGFHAVSSFRRGLGWRRTDFSL